jgi:hypothetical protein
LGNGMAFASPAWLLRELCGSSPPLRYAVAVDSGEFA